MEPRFERLVVLRRLREIKNHLEDLHDLAEENWIALLNNYGCVEKYYILIVEKESVREYFSDETEYSDELRDYSLGV